MINNIHINESDAIKCQSYCVQDVFSVHALSELGVSSNATTSELGEAQHHAVVVLVLSSNSDLHPLLVLVAVLVVRTL